MTTMKAVLVDPEKGAVFRNTYPKPQRNQNEALIKVNRAGICNTDLEILKGYSNYTGVLGHEFIGVVEEIDSHEIIKVGTRVVGEINLCCGQCEVCSQGGIPRRNHCPNRTVMGIIQKDGTFAEYITLPVSNLFPVPDSIDDSRGAFVEPLAAAFRIVEQIKTSNKDTVAVIGDGKLGNLIAQVMVKEPLLKLIHFGKHESKLNKVPGGTEKILVDENTESKYSDYFSVCVEASGSPSGLMMAAKITKPLGTIILKSTCAAGTKEFNTQPYVVKELVVVGSRCGNFEMAIKALESKDIEVSHLIDKVFAFDDVLEAIKAAGVKGTMKIQLKMC